MGTCMHVVYIKVKIKINLFKDASEGRSQPLVFFLEIAFLLYAMWPADSQMQKSPSFCNTGFLLGTVLSQEDPTLGVEKRVDCCTKKGGCTGKQVSEVG